MARETKFGFLFVLVLTGVFGMLVYKRMHEPLGLVAATANEANDEGAPPEGTPGDDSATAATSTSSEGANDPGLLAPVVDLPPQRPTSPSTTPSSPGTPLAALPRGSLTPPGTSAANTSTTTTKSTNSAEDPFGGTPAPSSPSKPKLPTTVADDFFSSPADSAPKVTTVATTPAKPALTASTPSKPTVSAASPQDDPFGFSAPSSQDPPATTVAASPGLSSPGSLTSGVTTKTASPVTTATDEEDDPFGVTTPANTPRDAKTTTAMEVSGRPSATVAATNPSDSFDPFTGQPVASTKLADDQKTTSTEEADPFEAPIDMKSPGSPALPTELDDDFSDPKTISQPKAAASLAVDDFTDIKKLQEPARPAMRNEPAFTDLKVPTNTAPAVDLAPSAKSDPFASLPADKPAPATAKTMEAPSLGFETDELESPKTAASPRMVESSTSKAEESAFDPLDKPATKSSSTPALAVPVAATPKMTPLPTEADPFETAQSPPAEQPAALPKATPPAFDTQTVTTALPTFDPEPQPVPRANQSPATATGTTANLDDDFAPVTRTTPRPTIENTGSYVVQPGDNYWTISRQLYGSGRYFQALAKHNASVAADPQKLKPGMQIATPAGTELETRYRAEMPLTATNPTATSQPTNSGGKTPQDGEADPGFFLDTDGVPRYRIGAADTLSLIARNHLGRSSRWVQIYEMNRDILKDGNTLSVGTVLHLPPDASQVQSVMTSPAGR